MTDEISNITQDQVFIKEPNLKGCWSQEETELRECVSGEECIVDTRRVGYKDRAAKFCCCMTHNCNSKLIYKILLESSNNG